MSDILKKYRKRIVRERALKALFLGLIFGSVALTLCVIVSWLVGFREGLWVGLALFAAVAAATALPLYFFKYKPTAKAVAARVDALGLEERVLTMTELDGDDSFMARMQREDTERALGKANHLMLKLALSAALFIMLGFALFFGLGATTVGSLYQAGVIPSGIELLSGTSTAETFTVTYTVQAKTDGTICLWDEAWGEPEMLDETGEIRVEEGGTAPAVYALDGPTSLFIGWSDGVSTRYRQDANITKNLTVVALFTEVTEDEIPQDDTVMNDNAPGNTPSDFPPKPGDKPGDGANPDGDGGGDGGEEGGGSSSQENQQIIDGDTYYGDEYSDAYDSAMDRLGSDDGLGDDLKGWISDYYDSIHKGGSSDGGEGNP